MYLGLCTVDSPRFLKCIAVSQSLESSLTVRCPADSPESPARTRPHLWQWTASEAPHRLQETPAKTPPICTHRHTQWITDLKIYYTKIKIHHARYFSPLINFCEQQFTDNKICKYKFPLTKCFKKLLNSAFFINLCNQAKWCYIIRNIAQSELDVISIFFLSIITLDHHQYCSGHVSSALYYAVLCWGLLMSVTAAFRCWNFNKRFLIILIKNCWQAVISRLWTQWH